MVHLLLLLGTCLSWIPITLSDFTLYPAVIPEKLAAAMNVTTDCIAAL